MGNNKPVELMFVPGKRVEMWTEHDHEYNMIIVHHLNTIEKLFYLSWKFIPGPTVKTTARFPET